MSDPDTCMCQYHEAQRDMAYALFRRPGASLDDWESWDYYRRMARKMSRVQWAKLCGLRPWAMRVVSAWTGLQGKCDG